MSDKSVTEGGNPFDTFARILEEHAEKFAKDVTLRLAGSYAGKVRESILSQQYKDQWPPLNPEYLARKKKLGMDTRMLRATGEYAASIVPRLGKDGKSYVVEPGDRPHSPTKLSKSQINLIELGEILEFGTKTKRKLADGTEVPRIKARPHWRPVWDEFMRTLPITVEEFKGKVWEKIQPTLQAALRKAEKEKIT